MAITEQRIPFRLIQMPCCQTLICHVNDRWPSYCSNCGAFVFPEVKGCSLVHDTEATLRYDSEKRT